MEKIGSLVKIGNLVNCNTAFAQSKDLSAIIVDVRSYEELELLGSVPLATHIPWYIWEKMFNFKLLQCDVEDIKEDLKKEKFMELVGLMRDAVLNDRKICLLCATGRRTNLIIDNIEDFNVSVFSIDNGLTAWWENGLPFEAVE